MTNNGKPPLTQSAIKEALMDKELQCHYHETIVNSTKDMIFVTDGSTVLDANKAMVEFCQQGYQDVYAKEFSLAGFFEPVEKFGYIFEGYKNKSWLDNVINNPLAERVGVVQKGKLFTFNISASPLEKVGDVYVVTLSDVTEMMGDRVVLEAGIKSSAKDRDKSEFLLRQYDKAIEAATLVCKCNLNGVITYANDALSRTMLYGKGELVNKHISLFRGKSITDEEYEKVWNRVHGGKIYKGTLENCDKLGGEHYFDISIIPILDGEGKIVEFLLLHHEITEVMEAKETALKTLEAKNKFFDQASHELRTPLNAIINFTDSALESFDEMFLDEESKELVKMYIQRAHTNSQHLLELINSLLDMAKLRAGKETFSMVECDAVELAKGVYHSVLALNSNPDVEFEFEFPHEHLMIRCDVLKMRQILLNLVSNALKFTIQGSVILRIRAIDDTCRMEVEDTGAGIPQEKIKKIFEPFEQVSSADQGTGLGLGIVNEYAKGMKMKMLVSSKEGFGSVFVVKAPLLATYQEEN